MANLFVTLPAPAGNGSGAAVDVSNMDAAKTVTVVYGTSVYKPIVTIEISNDVAGTNWAPLVSFTTHGEKNVSVAARWMRATVSNYKDGPAPTVGVGALNNPCQFATPIAPAGPGTVDGAGLDVSALPGFKTVQVAGAFGGTLNVQISEDGGVTYTTVASFQAPGQQSGMWTGDHVRIRREGVPVTNAVVPTVNIGANSSGSGGGGGAGTTQRFVYVATGAEGDTFVVNLPAARANTNYVARATGGGLGGGFLVFDCPTANYTTTQITVKASAPPVLNDRIIITAEDLT